MKDALAPRELSGPGEHVCVLCGLAPGGCTCSPAQSPSDGVQLELQRALRAGDYTSAALLQAELDELRGAPHG